MRAIFGTGIGITILAAIRAAQFYRRNPHG